MFFAGFLFWSAQGVADGDSLPGKKRQKALSHVAVCRSLRSAISIKAERYLAGGIQQLGIFVFQLISPVTNGMISSSSAAGWRRSRLSFGDRVIWTRASDGWCGVLQVVKTAQSRGRTERTLLVR